MTRKDEETYTYDDLSPGDGRRLRLYFQDTRIAVGITSGEHGSLIGLSNVDAMDMAERIVERVMNRGVMPGSVRFLEEKLAKAHAEIARLKRVIETTDDPEQPADRSASKPSDSVAW